MSPLDHPSRPYRRSTARPGRPRPDAAAAGEIGGRPATTERIIIGPCLTRAEAARRAGISPQEVPTRPDLLRLQGTWLEETYFAFQFDETGVRPDLGDIVQSLKGRYDDPQIAYWLARPNPRLDHYSPLSWIRSGRSTRRVIAAARHEGPVANNAKLPTRRPGQHRCYRLPQRHPPTTRADTAQARRWRERIALANQPWM